MVGYIYVLDDDAEAVMTPQFSIIIPTYNRADGRLQRALDSVAVQTCDDWECLVIDDGSTDHARLAVFEQRRVKDKDISVSDSTNHTSLAIFDERLGLPVWRVDDGSDPVVESHWTDGRWHYIRHRERQQRVVARNTGMRLAQGDWLCWLDDDDGWDQEYLRTFAHHIEQEPDVRLWVAGAIVHGQAGQPDNRVAIAWTKIRPAWMPPIDTNGQHRLFPSGHIGTGMFIYHRECYENIGLMPPWKHPDDCADGIDEWLGLEFGTTGYGSGKRGPVERGLIGKGHVGNPWGDDHCWMLALTRHYQVHVIHAALYVHYVR